MQQVHRGRGYSVLNIKGYKLPEWNHLASRCSFKTNIREFLAQARSGGISSANRGTWSPVITWITITWWNNSITHQRKRIRNWFYNDFLDERKNIQNRIRK